MGKSQRVKGHGFERAVARIFRDIWPEAARGIQTRRGTKESPDVDGTPFYVECKKGKRTNIKAAMRQATENTDGRPSLAVTQDDRKEILVTMNMSTFLAIMGGSNAAA